MDIIVTLDTEETEALSVKIQFPGDDSQFIEQILPYSPIEAQTIKTSSLSNYFQQACKALHKKQRKRQ